MSLIYIADDDKNLCEILKQHLTNEGYQVETFLSGLSLLEFFHQTPCHLIISDIMMPDMNGYDLCKSVRSISDVPFIMLSAKSEEIDRILGLELGSDDYISKPFSLREITIKVRNMLRRCNRTIVKDLNKLTCKDLELLLDERSALISRNLIQVTAKEFDLLEFFLKNKNVALSREQIIENVWEQDIIIESRQVDHLIKRLRKKLIEKESEFRIETVWGYGYKVSEHEN